MPLIPRTVPTETLEIDGDVYTLKTMLNGFERDQSNPLSGWKVQATADQLQGRDLDPEKMLDVVPDIALSNLRRIRLWLVKWSHPEPCNSEHMRRLPPSHWDALLKRIDELEQLQNGPTAESEVGKLSNESSEQILFIENPSS